MGSCVKSKRVITWQQWCIIRDVGCASHSSAPHPAASEQEIRADEREKVLDELKAWLASDREFCHRIGAIPAMLSHACVIDLIETMRRQPQEQPHRPAQEG